ncbi:hypothetical protein P170DRAFT_63494 [Aspergillus steynii IBT 23096]|uniref:C2H2-type domain-containing protein n=1 Tax=Aspergillus steynii IBT 23096 TaxID=1392250 RepID=A0A2I2FT92_9EURO|nr:uncharacterized protein P170DRAFT_63494 [Aspergillus steynii IBT 23096]PLB43849.1 hypothetical protein P170DRAFT_63494 [Aspergillus steynii IBT 23096]
MKAHPVPSTEWVCSMRHTVPSKTVMQSAEEFASHMRDEHTGRFTDIQIKSLQDRAARPGSMFPDCLFCDWSLPPDSEQERIPGSLTPVEEHTADHLFDLALMSLPQTWNTKGDGEDERDSLANVSLDSGNQNSHSVLSQNLSGFDNSSYRSPSASPLGDDGVTNTLIQEGMTGSQSPSQMLPGQEMMVQQQQQPQTASQPPVTVPPTAPQVEPEPQTSQPSAQQVGEDVTIKSKATASGKGNKPSFAEQTSKSKLHDGEPTEEQSTPMQKQFEPAVSQGGPAFPEYKPNLPFNRAEMAAMTRQQRAQLEMHIRQRRAQGLGLISMASAEDAWNNLPERIKMIYDEIVKAAPPDEPVTVVSEQKATMSQQLRDLINHLGRMDALVQFISNTIPDQKRSVRTLLSLRVQLMRQFKPGSNWELADYYTITPRGLENAINYIKEMFDHMNTHLDRVAEQNGQRSSMPTPSQESFSLPSISSVHMPSLRLTGCQWADCVYASKNWDSWEGLLRHIERDHILDREDLYVCSVDECSRNLPNKADLMAHLQLRHQDNPKAMEQDRELRENVTQSARVLHCKWSKCVSTDLYSSNELVQHIYTTHVAPEPWYDYTHSHNAMEADANLPTENDPQDVTVEEESASIRCICEFSHDDGATICCDKCNKWQHIICYYEDDLNYPETHVCGECQPRLFNIQRAKRIQEQQLEQAASQHREEKSSKKRRHKNATGDISKRNRKGWAESSPLPRRAGPEFAPDLFPHETEPFRKRKLRTPSAPLPRSATSPQNDIRDKKISLQEDQDRQMKE